MAQQRIEELRRSLEQQGIKMGDLSGLQEELDAIQRPPTLLGRLTQRARQTASAQWKNIVGELTESREMMGLLNKRLRHNEPLSAAEADKIRSQMLDLLRIVPAGFIAAANSALPVPGTGIFTPWILARLGLMPSHWREAHLLDKLHKEAERLRAQGHDDAAKQVEALEAQLEQEADARELAQHQAALLTHWDANQNGVWDDDERASYQLALTSMSAIAKQRSNEKRWYLSMEHQVFGPVRLSEIITANPEAKLMVCFDGNSGWLCLEDLSALLDGES